MNEDDRILLDVLRELDENQSGNMRFQVICPSCSEMAWTSDNKIGQQITCGDCDAAITVKDPDDDDHGSDILHLVVAETPLAPNPYTVVTNLGLSPMSSITDMFLAYHDGEEGAEALRQLRDPVRRFTFDLLCCPQWQKRGVNHEPK